MRNEVRVLCKFPGSFRIRELEYPVDFKNYSLLNSACKAGRRE